MGLSLPIFGGNPKLASGREALYFRRSNKLKRAMSASLVSHVDALLTEAFATCGLPTETA
jgi:hypothetical protein